MNSSYMLLQVMRLAGEMICWATHLNLRKTAANATDLTGAIAHCQQFSG